ncbi:MAG: DUF58 domain-containing protein, partial [Clostridiales bacterium]|nr:DUF58 domain-containing protein [Clostridiales bacterium]
MNNNTDKVREFSKTGRDDYSSLFVSYPALIIWFAAAAAAARFGFFVPAAFLLFIFIICLIAKIWGLLAVKNLSLVLDAQAGRFFQGQEAVFTYTVGNHKLLPLIWLEVIQTLPQTRCLWPLEEEGVCMVSRHEETRIISEPALKKRFSFLLWNQSLSWDVVWRAQKRGVFRLGGLKLITGDAFGLMQRGADLTPDPPPLFVVYPRIQPVDADLFLRFYYDCFSGSKGYMDDATVIKGARDYQATDSCKHINWRLAARGQALQVNMFESVLPRAAHFIIDGESFSGLSPEFDELEDVLSIVASLMLRLDEAQVRYGLSLPRGEGSPPLNLFVSQGAVLEEALYHLSDYRCLEKLYDADKLYGKAKESAPSEFDEQSLFSDGNNLGRIYYVVYDAEKMRKRFHQLRQFDVVRYAQKACSNLAVLKLLKNEGACVDCVSAYEIRRALAAGFSEKRHVSSAPIVFTADIFDRETLDLVVEKKIPVNCGSTDMIWQLGEKAPGQEIT